MSHLEQINAPPFYCETSESIVTPQGDLIPKGTAVVVERWSEDAIGCLEVRVQRYWCIEGPAVCKNWEKEGLLVDIDPSQLTTPTSLRVL